MLLEAVYEPHFHAFSYGFRRQRSAHGALSYLRDQCLKLGINWIIDADIAKFFDTMSRHTCEQSCNGASTTVRS
jgi:retron-type reverse transcriptase